MIRGRGRRAGRSPASRRRAGQRHRRSTPPAHSAVVLAVGSSTTKRAPVRAVGPVLDPHPAAVEADVLGDERQAEADALARCRAARRRRRGRSGRRSARARRSGTPGPAVLDRDLHAVVDARAGCTAVAPSPYLAALSSRLARTRARRRLSARTTTPARSASSSIGTSRCPERADRLEDELGEADVVEVEPHGAGVEAADLEQVLDELVEPVDLGGRRGRAACWPRVGQLVALASRAPRRRPPASSAASAARGSRRRRSGRRARSGPGGPGPCR